MDFHALEIYFPIDEQISHWRFKPGSYLANIIGHEGAGSLHSYLKERGWITTLSTGVLDLGRSFATFKITLYLSENGFREPTVGLYPLPAEGHFDRKPSRSWNGNLQIHVHATINRP